MNDIKRTLAIGGLALLGLVVAVAITLAASSLSSQPAGIYDEPIDAGAALAVPRETVTRTTTVTRPTTTATTTPPRTTTDDDDDDGGRGRGRGRGRGGDDDD